MRDTCQLTNAYKQNIAAQQNHRDACFALTAWYLVGSPGVLPQSDTEAYLWAKKAADAGLAKAMYAVGYFLEVGIGAEPNMSEYALNCRTSLYSTNGHATRSIIYYKKAAEQGDKRASQRLKGSPNAPMPQPGGAGAVVSRDGPDGLTSAIGVNGKGKDGKDKDCVIM